jgi:hypothetical protein
MIDSLDGMVVMVSYQQKAIEFYTQKLGSELRSDTPFGSGTTRDILWVGSCTEGIPVNYLSYGTEYYDDVRRSRD